MDFWDFFANWHSAAAYLNTVNSALTALRQNETTKHLAKMVSRDCIPPPSIPTASPARPPRSRPRLLVHRPAGPVPA